MRHARKKHFKLNVCWNQSLILIWNQLEFDANEESAMRKQLHEENEEQTLRQNSRQRISCFTHSLQLVVGDGLSDTRCVNKAIAKIIKLSTLLHRSTVF